LRVQVTATEYHRLRDQFKTTTYRGFSKCIRALLEREPMVKKYRNQFLDDLYQGLVGLKNEVDGCGRSFGDAVEALKLLHPGPAQTEAFEYLAAEAFSAKMNIDHIKQTLIKIYEECVRGDTASQR
jgi:hypothetical protein